MLLLGKILTESLFPTHHELAVEAMQQLVQDSPNKIQNEILLRYMNEAPEHLQSSRQQDLADLLNQIAIREKRHDDIRPRWYLADGAEQEALDFQPRRGRRSEKRIRAHIEQSAQVDEELVAMGRSTENRWLELIQWHASESPVTSGN